MTVIAEKAEEIKQALADRRTEWIQRLEDINADIERAQRDMNADSAKNDRSENAEYQIAADTFAQLQVSRRQIQEKIDAYSSFMKIDNKAGLTPVVVIGTTMKLRLLKINDKSADAGKDIFYVKLVPAALGIARVGAISSNSSVGRAVEGLSVGSVFTVQTRKGKITYQIEELY